MSVKAAKVNVTAFSARQKVTGFVADEISTNMHAGEPRLVLSERIIWRVPVILSLPPSGDRGEVCTIDVDGERRLIVGIQATTGTSLRRYCLGGG